MNDTRRSVTTPDPSALLILGLLPAAAVSVRVADALWMAAGVVCVLVASSLCISLIARWTADPGPLSANGRAADTPGDDAGARWLGALVVSSCLTAVFETVLLITAPEASAALGIYGPLIAVNCLVLGRIEAASHRVSIGRSAAEAARTGIGFALCLVLVALVREALGAGTITLFAMPGFSGTIAVPLLSADPARALGFAGGALLCLGYLAAAVRSLLRRTGGREAAVEGRP